jgi:hypothetical protein
MDIRSGLRFLIKSLAGGLEPPRRGERGFLIPTRDVGGGAAVRIAAITIGVSRSAQPQTGCAPAAVGASSPGPGHRGCDGGAPEESGPGDRRRTSAPVLIALPAGTGAVRAQAGNSSPQPRFRAVGGRPLPRRATHLVIGAPRARTWEHVVCTPLSGVCTSLRCRFLAASHGGPTLHVQHTSLLASAHIGVQHDQAFPRRREH